MDTETILLHRVRAANEAWTQGRPAEVASLFHPEVVMAGADGRVLAEGREALVATFEEFAAGARTLHFEESAHRVKVFGDTAVVSYEFDVAYELLEDPELEPQRERGRELLVFAHDGDRDAWTVVWREQVPLA